jgi:uncharacterized coiled-coil protein SlyX
MAFWDLPQQFWAIARKFDELLSLQKRTEKSVDAILERLHALELRVIQREADRGQMITEAKAAAGVAASGVASMIVSDAITRITRLEIRLADQPPRPPSAALPELPA